MKRAATLGTLLLLLAAGCGSEESSNTSTATTVAAGTTSATTEPVATSTIAPAATTTSTTPRRNEVVIGTDMRPNTLNPLAPGGDNAITLEINQAIGIGLTESHGDTLELVPDLAVEIPSVANGGVVVAPDGAMTVTFRLRQEAVWEDGTSISGDDVVFTYEVIMAQTARPRLTEPYESIRAIEAGPKSVTLHFDQPTLFFEELFPYIIPKHQVEGTDPVADWMETPWLAAGPFKFESWEEPELRLVRNEAFWKIDPDTGEQLPHLDHLVFRWIPETQALVDAFKAGKIDVVAIPPFPTWISDLDAIDGVEVALRDSPIWEHFTFQFGTLNRNQDSLNQHVEFRRAVAHLIDRQAVADRDFWGTRTTLEGILGLHGVASDDPWAQYGFDPPEARRLLAGLCTALGRDCEADPPRLVFSTTSNADERPQIGRMLVDMLAEGGIEVELDLEDSSIFFGPTLDHGTWDLGMWAWVAQPSPAGILGTFEVWDPDGAVDSGEYPPGAGRNFARWGTLAVTGAGEGFDQGPSQVRDEHTARYAAILDEMQATADRDVLFTLAREAEQILADQMVLIPLVTRSSAAAVWTSRVSGYVHSPWNITWNVEEWRTVG